MEKMKKCKACGAHIAKSAKICPHCGAKNGGSKIPLIIVIVIVLLIVIAAIGGSGNSTPQKVNGDGSSVNNSENTTFEVGDKVELDDIAVTLVGVESSSGTEYMAPSDGNVFVICEFEIENNSDSEIVVSSALSFEAYADDYAINFSLGGLTMSDKSQLDGTVAAGKKFNGVVSFEAPADWETLEVHYTPNFWAGKDIVFTANS